MQAQHEIIPKYVMCAIVVVTITECLICISTLLTQLLYQVLHTTYILQGAPTGHTTHFYMHYFHPQQSSPVLQQHFWCVLMLQLYTPTSEV